MGHTENVDPEALAAFMVALQRVADAVRMREQAGELLRRGEKSMRHAEREVASARDALVQLEQQITPGRPVLANRFVLKLANALTWEDKDRVIRAFVGDGGVWG